MARPAACPHCGEELDIPPELRGRPVRCAACRQVFTPSAGAAPQAPTLPAPGTWDEERPSRRPPRASRVSDRPRDGYDDRGRDDDYDDRWDDRPRRRRRRKQSNAWVWAVLAGVFVLCVLPCGGLMVLGMIVSFPNFEPYDSADGRFHGDFPGKPVTSSHTSADGLTHHTTEYQRGFPPEKYFVRYVDLPARPRPAADPTQVLRDAADKELARVPGSTEAARTTGKHDGYDCLDLTMEHPDGTGTVVRFVLAGRRLYAVGITGPDGLNTDEPRVQHFLQAFKVKTPPGENGK